MSRGCEVAGVTPSRMAARRKGPICSKRKSPSPRIPWAGRKSDSRLRLRTSTVSARLVTSARRKFGDCRGIAHAKIEPLCADRRQHVGGLADQHDASCGQLLCGLGDKWKVAATRLDSDLAKDRMGTAF